MKKLIFTTTILYLGLVLSIALSGFMLYQSVNSSQLENNSPTKQVVLYKISGYDSVSDYIWKDDETLIFISNNKLVEYSVEARTETSVSDISGKTKLGLSGNGLLLCQWENQVITDPSEFSTTLRLLDKDLRSQYEFQLYPTVEPISCSNKQIILQANYPGAPETQYKLTVSDGQIYELAPGKYKSEEIAISGTETTEISHDGNNYKIDKFNNFINAKTNSSGRAFALLDGNGFIWIYQLE